MKTVLPGDVLTEIKRQLDWRSASGAHKLCITLSRREAEALLRAPELINQAIDDGIKEFLINEDNQACGH